MASGNKTMKMTMEFVGEDKVSKVTSAVGANLKRVTKEQKKSQGMLGKSKEQWALFAAGMNGAIGVAGALMGAIGKIGDAVKSGAKAIGIESAFRRAIPAADDLLARMEEASRFTIDETSLMRFGAKMKRAGVDVAQIPQIMELATKAAVATGTEITVAVQSITDSFIKQNDRGFKALDINLDLSRHFDNQARSLGKSTTQLTKNEKITTMLAVAAEELGVAFGNIGLDNSVQVQMTQMQKKWEDVKSDFEVHFAHRMGIAATNVGRIGDGFDYVWESLKTGAYSIGTWSDQSQEIRDAAEAEADARDRSAAAYRESGKVKAPPNVKHQKELNAALQEFYAEARRNLPFEQQLAMLKRDKAIAAAKERDDAEAGTQDIRDKNKTTLRAISLEGTHLANLNMNAEAGSRWLKLYKSLIGQSKEFNSWQHKTGNSWEKAAETLEEVNEMLRQHTKDRIEQLAIEAKAGPLAKQQIQELQKLQKTMAEYGISMEEAGISGEQFRTMQIRQVESLERTASARSKNAAAMAQTAIAQENYTIAAKEADTAWREGESAGEDYRVKNIQIRNALIKSTKAQLDNARAIYETMEAEAALGAMTDPTFGAKIDAARKKMNDIAAFAKKLQALGSEKKKPLGKKPTGKPKTALIDLAKEEADAVAEIREEIFKKEETQRGVDRMRELWSPETWNKGAADIHAYAEEQARAIAEGLELTWGQVGAAMMEEANALTDDFIETLDRKAQAIQDFTQQITEDSRESFSNAVSFAGQFGNHWAAAMGQSLQIMEKEYQEWQRMQKAISSGAISQGTAYAKAAPGMIAAGGQVAASFIEDEKAKAGVLAAMEAVASIVAFAPPVVDIYGGTMHALAASMYTAIAAGAFKGSGRGGGGGAARKPPAAIAPRAPDDDKGSTNQITLNFSGTVVGSDDSAGRALAALLRREMKWQAPIDSSGAV